MDYRYSYDRDGLLLAKKASGRTLLSYRYDELGRKISQTDITGRQVNYRFDKSNVKRSTPTASSTACSRRNIQLIRNDSPTITPATA
jgi:YD repeat-containing protein